MFFLALLKLVRDPSDKLIVVVECAEGMCAAETFSEGGRRACVFALVKKIRLRL